MDAHDANTGMVLIVEDDPELRFVLKAHLHAIGFAVREANDGPTAIRIVHENPPDLVIMDIGLPEMDGLTVTRTLKSDPRSAHIPIIILTARSGKEEIVKGLEAGAQEYLQKPFDVAELLARVRTVHRLASARKDLNRLNTQLEAEVDAKTRRLQYLYEFMRDLNLARTRKEVLDKIVECVQDTTGAQRVSLFIQDPKTRLLKCERAIGFEDGDPDTPDHVEPGNITGKVLMTGKGMAATIIDPEGKGSDYSSESFVSVPFSSAEKAAAGGTHGVLNATDKSDRSAFSDEEIECIRSIAHTGAMVLDDVLRRRRLQHSVDILLQTLAVLSDYRDDETSRHLERVSQMVRILAKQIQSGGPYAPAITDEFVEMLVQAAPMHDIGKVGVPDEILTKPGKLTDEEFNIMKTHTEIGRNVLSKAIDPEFPNPLLNLCMDIAHCHHERYDGKGYPRRLKGTRIPLSARIVALVDAYDAITSRRRYKAAKPHHEAVEIIQSEAGRHFDPVLVDAFMACNEEFDAVRAAHEDDFEREAVEVAG